MTLTGGIFYDTPENNADAKRMAWREFKELDGLSVDVAMFPVDNRLEDAMEWGAIEFYAV